MLELTIIALLVIDLTYHIDRDFFKSKLAVKVLNKIPGVTVTEPKEKK